MKQIDIRDFFRERSEGVASGGSPASVKEPVSSGKSSFGSSPVKYKNEAGKKEKNDRPRVSRGGSRSGFSSVEAEMISDYISASTFSSKDVTIDRIIDIYTEIDGILEIIDECFGDFLQTKKEKMGFFGRLTDSNKKREKWYLQAARMPLVKNCNRRLNELIRNLRKLGDEDGYSYVWEQLNDLSTQFYD